MLRRRTIFATPLVVVLGCSHPSDHTTSTPQTKRDDAAQVVPDDAADHVDVKDPGPNETGMGMGSGCVSGPGRRCNPPAPVHVKDIVVDGRVTKQKNDPDQGGVVFFVYLSESADVTEQFTGLFLDDRGPIANTHFEIKIRNGRELTCLLKGHAEVPSKRVRLYENPPGVP